MKEHTLNYKLNPNQKLSEAESKTWHQMKFKAKVEDYINQKTQIRNPKILNHKLAEIKSI